MPLDFNKLRDAKKQPPVVDPVEIFRRLPKKAALAHRAPLEAIERLKGAVPYGLAMPGTVFYGKFGGLYTAYVRGRAYLAAGRGEEAASEFQKILKRRGVVLADPIGALAHLQLGRAYVVSGGQSRGKKCLSGVPGSLAGCGPGHPCAQTDEGRIREAIVILPIRIFYLKLCGAYMITPHCNGWRTMENGVTRS